METIYKAEMGIADLGHISFSSRLQKTFIRNFRQGSRHSDHRKALLTLFFCAKDFTTVLHGCQ